MWEPSERGGLYRSYQRVPDDLYTRYPEAEHELEGQSEKVHHIH